MVCAVECVLRNSDAWMATMVDGAFGRIACTRREDACEGADCAEFGSVDLIAMSIAARPSRDRCSIPRPEDKCASHPLSSQCFSFRHLDPCALVILKSNTPD